MSATDETLNELIRHLSEAARMLIETRARETMTLANVTAEDLKTGRATAERVTTRHPECGGTGIVTTFDKTSGRLFATVELCKCFEVKIVRPMGGDAWVHV